MGNSQTTASSDPNSLSSVHKSSLPVSGYRVLGVQPNSPASSLGFVPYFDFIIKAAGTPLLSMDSTFIDIIKASEEKPLNLVVFNSKNQSFREIVLVPSSRWPGRGLLGLTIRYESISQPSNTGLKFLGDGDVDSRVYRILEVTESSPADLAGLHSEVDYILGSAEKSYPSTNDFYDDLSNSINRPIELYVYNSESDEVRVTIIMPCNDWGGEGIIGASIGNGYLHYIPSRCLETLGKPSSEFFLSSTNIIAEKFTNEEDDNELISNENDVSIQMNSDINPNDIDLEGGSNIHNNQVSIDKSLVIS